MKKAVLLAALLALFLLPPCQAESLTRTAVVYVEGEAETVTETYYQNDQMGISLWYDAETLAITDDSGEAGPGILIQPADPDNFLPIYMEILLPGATGPEGMAFLNEMPGKSGMIPLGDVALDLTDTGLGSAWLAAYAPETNGYCQFILVWSREREIQAIIQCPMEAAEGYGRRMFSILNTLAFI